MEAANLLVVLGPTASGKTAFAAHLARLAGGEVISADSRQVYRQMNLGTGKDYEDYRVDGLPVPVHLIDIADPGYRYSVYEYQRDFFRVFEDIRRRGRIPVLCGGSGLYLDAATRGYRLAEVPPDEALRRELRGMSLDALHQRLAGMKTLHNTTDVDTPERAIRAIEIETYYQSHPEAGKAVPEIRPLFIGIRYARDTERARITERLRRRFAEGMADEVRQLLEGRDAASIRYYGLEYRYITDYLTGVLPYEEMFRLLNTAIHQFAKRQMTWFRKMERDGAMIHWIGGELPMEEKLQMASGLLHQRPLV